MKVCMCANNTCQDVLKKDVKIQYLDIYRDCPVITSLFFSIKNFLFF